MGIRKVHRATGLNNPAQAKRHNPDLPLYGSRQKDLSDLKERHLNPIKTRNLNPIGKTKKYRNNITLEKIYKVIAEPIKLLHNPRKTVIAKPVKLLLPKL